MTLNAIKTTSGYIVEGKDAVGKDVELFFDKEQSSNYDYLVDVEDSFFKHAEYKDALSKLPDPERDLYVSIFGAGNEPADTALHTTLAEPVEARDGISLDWTSNSVTVALRLIAKGKSNRLRLINGGLVDMGEPVQVPAPVNPVPAGGPIEGNANASGELHIGG